MSYEEIIAEGETHRVKIVVDEYPENPREMGDSFAAVLTQLSDSYAQPDKDYDDRIIQAWQQGRAAWKPNGTFCGTYHDPEKVERYARAFLGAVATGWLDDPRSSSLIFAYVTAERVAEFGVVDPQAELDAELEEYRAYCEGDVYGYVIELRVHEHTERSTLAGYVYEATDEDVWETVGSCWGFYGYEYAEREAREALSFWAREGK